ncbi:hypothetical protein C0995_006874 [Termitomyces sp. Mi166|nr:hypothetical protein C0995_006874 [Termitomyces sp. Mi166\
MAQKTMKEFTLEEVQKVVTTIRKAIWLVHTTVPRGSLNDGIHTQWIVIDSKVYDLSKFANLHPGGSNVLFAESVAGKDATQIFFGLHRQEVLFKPQYTRLQIGKIKDQEEHIRPLAPGELSQVPYAEPTWLSKGYFSPYYSDSHRRFQAAARRFFMEIIQPESASEANIIAMRLGPGKHLKGRTLLEGVVKPEEFDYFHEALLEGQGIIHAELARVSSRAVLDGLLAGLVIGVPPILNYGSPELRAKVIPDALSGKKFVALAISEAFAGSDVGGLQTTAVRDGDYWVVTGTKKWITNGTFADYFTTGCRTETGFTVLLIERGPGVTTKQIKTSYSSVAGTAYITFDKVRVPVSHTLGQVGNGMQVILSNFNHERWMVIACSISAQRLIVEECLKWATQRIVFGKPLTSQPVIRAKLAAMISRVEACQNWYESVTYQMNSMNYNEMSNKLAGPIGLLKQFVSRTARETAEGGMDHPHNPSNFKRLISLCLDATQVFGGRALTMTGMVLAGAEDVLGDLGVRQALKKMPRDARL